MHLLQLFESFILIPGFKWIRAHERGLSSTKNRKKMWSMGFLAIWRVKWRYWGDFSGMFRKKSKLFLQMWSGQGASSTHHAVSEFEVFLFFGHIVVSRFCQCGLESLEVLDNWSHSKVGSFNPWNHTEQWLSQPIFAGPQSLLDDFRSCFWDICKTVFDCSRAT